MCHTAFAFVLIVFSLLKLNKQNKGKHYDFLKCNYRQTSNISRTLFGNKIVDHSDVFGASPAGAAPTTSSFST